MIIGLLSDTHGYLDPQIAHYFQPCQEIWHAGDIGSMEVLASLKAIKPTFAVYGNIDDSRIRECCKEDLWLQREGMLILMTHIAGRPKRYHPRVRSLIASRKPQILVCGHSHMLKVQRDPAYRHMWFINPGAAGRQGFHRMKTVMRLELEQGQLKNMEVIELGKRGALHPR